MSSISKSRNFELYVIVLATLALLLSLSDCQSAESSRDNAPFLKSWLSAVALADTGKAPLSAVCLGDSNTEIFGYAGCLRLLLQSCYGDAGFGYYTLSKRMEEIPGAPKIERSGAWEFLDMALDPSIPAPPLPWLAIDGHWSATSDAAATLKVTGGGKYTLYLQRGPGLGSFDLLSGSATKTIDTAAVETGILTETIPSNAFTIHHVHGRIILFGVDARNPQTTGGAILHQLGKAWAMAHHYASIDQQAYNSFFAKTQPALITVLLGTNDMNNGWDAPGFTAQLNSLVGKLKQASPASSILIISAPSCTFDRKALAPAFDAATLKVARDNGCAFLDLCSIIGDDWQYWDQLGVMEYTLHYKAGGGMTVAREILRAIDFDWADPRHQPLLRHPADLLAPGVKPRLRSPVLLT